MAAMTPEQAADQLEIGQVLQRYGQALDEKRYELLDRVFTVGADLQYDFGGGGRFTYPDMVKTFREWLAPMYYTQHMFSPPIVELAGDRAQTRCRLIALHVQRTPAGESRDFTVYGFYQDDLVRTPDGWRIEKRLFKGMHTEGEPLPPDRAERFDKAPF